MCLSVFFAFSVFCFVVGVAFWCPCLLVLFWFSCSLLSLCCVGALLSLIIAFVSLLAGAIKDWLTGYHLRAAGMLQGGVVRAQHVTPSLLHSGQCQN